MFKQELTVVCPHLTYRLWWWLICSGDLYPAFRQKTCWFSGFLVFVFLVCAKEIQMHVHWIDVATITTEFRFFPVLIIRKCVHPQLESTTLHFNLLLLPTGQSDAWIKWLKEIKVHSGGVRAFCAMTNISYFCFDHFGKHRKRETKEK